MKGQVGTQDELLLWPNHAAMAKLYSLSRPRSSLAAAEDDDTLGLLWPAKLINEQARLRTPRDFSRPIAIITFAISIILAFIVGPTQLILTATTNDYNWVTSTYFPTALRYVLLTAGIMFLINCAALALAWRSQAKPARMTIALVCAGLLETGLCWLSGQVAWQPHQLTVILIGCAVFWFMVILLLSKQYLEDAENDLLTKITIVLLIISSLFGAYGCISQYAFAHNQQYDSLQINQLAANQIAAHIEGVPEQLSNSVFTLCNGKYEVVYLSEGTSSGLFQCVANGEVYSVAELDATSGRVRSTATYLGTTKDKVISAAFPDSYYLYRNMASILGENELVIMVQANSERELIENFVPEFYNYWQAHHNENLHLNVFYNRDLEAIESTKDYVLMAALETMTLVEKLPHGNTISGLHDGQIINYQYYADRDLTALNELGANPENYASSSLDALTTFRHISVRLTADEEFDENSLRQKLQESFAGGM